MGAIGIKTYSRITGILLLLVAVLGGTGLIPTALPADFFHAGVGTIFAYLGFAQRDAEVVRLMVGGMGVLLLVSKGTIILLPLAWGETPLHGPIEITCLLAGVLSIFAAKHLRGDTMAGD